MIETGAFIATIILLALLGEKLDAWAKKRAAKKRVEAIKAHIAAEEALFKRNLNTLWQKPEKDDEHS